MVNVFATFLFFFIHAMCSCFKIRFSVNSTTTKYSHSYGTLISIWFHPSNVYKLDPNISYVFPFYCCGFLYSYWSLVIIDTSHAIVLFIAFLLCSIFSIPFFLYNLYLCLMPFMISFNSNYINLVKHFVVHSISGQTCLHYSPIFVTKKFVANLQCILRSHI